MPKNSKTDDYNQYAKNDQMTKTPATAFTLDIKYMIVIDIWDLSKANSHNTKAIW